MEEKFLFIANDQWFDFDKFIKDNNFEFYWSKKPKSVFSSSKVYLYLAGKTKAIKYELEVVDDSVDYANIKTDYWNKYLLKQLPNHFKEENHVAICKLRVIREIKDLTLTSPSALKNNAKILGSLMSNRKLKPYSIEYLDQIK